MLCFEHFEVVVWEQHGYIVVLFIVFVMILMLFIPRVQEFVPGEVAVVVRIERF